LHSFGHRSRIFTIIDGGALPIGGLDHDEQVKEVALVLDIKSRCKVDVIKFRPCKFVF
jgi:hypothetical protein